MIGAISFHAIERLQQRRDLAHLLRHVNKIRKWNLPRDGETLHKGFKYVTRDGVLVTVYPCNEAIKEYKAQLRDEYMKSVGGEG